MSNSLRAICNSVNSGVEGCPECARWRSSRGSTECGHAWRRGRALSERAGELLLSADGAKHLSETGFRISGKVQWLQLLIPARLMLFRTTGLSRCVMHDYWRPYFLRHGVVHHGATRVTYARGKRYGASASSPSPQCQ